MDKREAEQRFEALKDFLFPKWDGKSTSFSMERKGSGRRGQLNPAMTHYPYPMCVEDENRAKGISGGFRYRYFSGFGSAKYRNSSWFHEPAHWGNHLAKYTDTLIRIIQSNKAFQEILEIDSDVFDPEYKWNTETIKKDLFDKVLNVKPHYDPLESYEYSHHSCIDFSSVCNRLISVLSEPPGEERESMKMDESYFGVEELDYCEINKLHCIATDRFDKKATEEAFQKALKEYKSFGLNVIPYMGGRLYRIMHIASCYSLRNHSERERCASYIKYLFDELMPRYWKKVYVAYKTGRLHKIDFSSFIRFSANGSCEYKLQDGFIKVLYKMLLHMEEVYCLENKERFSEKAKSREILSCLGWVYAPKDLENKAGALFQVGNQHKGRTGISYLGGIYVGGSKIKAVPVGIIRNKRKWLLLEPGGLFLIIPVKNNRGSYYRIIKQGNTASYISSLKGDKVNKVELSGVELDLLTTEAKEP